MPNTSTIAALDVTLDDLVVLHRGIDTIPALELARLFVREDELAFFVLGVLDENFDLFAHGEFGVVAEFGDGDHAFTLVADVDDHFAFVEADDRSFDNFAFDDVRQGLVILFGDLLFGFVVDSGIAFESRPVEIFVADGLFCCFGHCV